MQRGKATLKECTLQGVSWADCLISSVAVSGQVNATKKVKKTPQNKSQQLGSEKVKVLEVSHRVSNLKSKVWHSKLELQNSPQRAASLKLYSKNLASNLVGAVIFYRIFLHAVKIYFNITGSNKYIQCSSKICKDQVKKFPLLSVRPPFTTLTHFMTELCFA